MEVVHARCAGLDISKRDAKLCIRLAGAGRGWFVIDPHVLTVSVVLRPPHIYSHTYGYGCFA
jgi:hypothetical protein